jgi:hypothetical protein
MCCEDLVCARCGGPVAEARCPACRVARATVHHSTFAMSPQVLVVMLLTLVALFFLVYHHT